MAPQVLDLAAAGDPRDAVHRVVQALAEGKVVALPTETVYIAAASGLSERGVQRLLAIRGGKLDGPAPRSAKPVCPAAKFASAFRRTRWSSARCGCSPAPSS